MDKKGFVLTMDATFAIVIAIVMITAILFFISAGNPSSDDNELQLQALSLLSSMESSGALSEAARTGGSKSDITSLFESLPDHICGRIELYSYDASGGYTFLEADEKDNCVFSDNYIVVRRVFLSGGDIHLAKLEVWRR